MATNLQNLKSAKENIVSKLLEMTDPAKLKPTYSIDGQQVSWAEYHRMLTEQLKAINELIIAEEPFLIKTQVL